MDHDISRLTLDWTTQGVRTARIESTPDEAGSVGRFAVDLPAYTWACYYAADQMADPVQSQGWRWPAGANRLQPLAMERLSDLTPGGLLLLLELADGRHAALLPLAGSHTAASLQSSADRLILDVSSFGAEAVAQEAPLLAWACGDDPYEAVWRAWMLALSHPLMAGGASPRHEKAYPEPFEYLGWCSWEQYKTQIDQATILGAVDAIEASGLPIRYVLVDDGHEWVEDQKLLNFGPDPKKFPQGLKPLLDRRREEGVRWCGLWMNLNGMWEGISPRHTMKSLSEHLAETTPGGIIKAKPRWESIRAYLEAMLESARGFDFVKVDDQAECLRQYRGARQGVHPARRHNRLLEAMCRQRRQGLINCMAHNSVCAFNTVHSAVTRCSADYKVGNARLSKAHIHQSFANALYFGPTVWLDHDMFHSSDLAAGRAMAISKALGGGPIYLSDDPMEFDADNIRPLCLNDGRLLRPLAPGAPLPDSIYVNPSEGSAAYRVVAPLANGAAAVGLFNLTEPGRPVTGSVDSRDWRCADAMQPGGVHRAAPEGGLILFDHQSGRATRLDKALEVSLEQFEGRLYLLCPIVHGWSVVGRIDKFLSPAAVEALDISAEELRLLVSEPGEVAIWSDQPVAAASDGIEVTQRQPDLWIVRWTGSGDPAGREIALVHRSR